MVYKYNVYVCVCMHCCTPVSKHTYFIPFGVLLGFKNVCRYIILLAQVRASLQHKNNKTKYEREKDRSPVQ